MLVGYYMDLKLNADYTDITITICPGTGVYTIPSMQNIKLAAITVLELDNIKSKDEALNLLLSKTRDENVYEFLETSGIIDVVPKEVDDPIRIERILNSSDFQYHFCHHMMRHEDNRACHVQAECWKLARDSFSSINACFSGLTQAFNALRDTLKLRQNHDARRITSWPQPPHC